ncbi:MAG: DUF2508 family protein [Firmicutes bacterium]|nr:DUF2508 family protein [Bacillota bacterium]
MLDNLSLRLRDLASRIFDEERELLSEPEEIEPGDLAQTVDKAKQEWLNAQSYFDNAVEPELVDHAILCLQAAERKYMYWLRRMKYFK